MKILLLDNTAPWIVSLFDAAAVHGANVSAIRPKSLGAPRSSAGTENNARKVIVPGWTRFTGLSTWLLARAVRQMLRRQPNTDAIVYTLPQYAGVAERITGPMCAYFAFDPYRFYDWDANTTAALERRMLNRANVVFAVAEALSEDFRSQTRTAVVTCRNAVSRSFIQRMRQGPTPPRDLAKLRRPIVGCTGQINRSYDWDLIAELARQFPAASFVFIGQMFEEPSPMREKIRSVLQMVNVHWLGPRPHEQLPEYLAGFDVCFNPLVVSEHNDRRSPLRLYDYLATDKPILSTAIREAAVHRPFVHIGATAAECGDILNRFIDGQHDCDLADRHHYIEQNTWEDRAALLLEALQRIGESRA
jgi:glycosyltransferase involved in cell wall biosynthesis